MSFLRENILTSLLEGTQSEQEPVTRRVLGFVILTVLSVISVAALALLIIDTPASTLERVWYVVLIAIILWYYIGCLKKILRRIKRS